MEHKTFEVSELKTVKDSDAPGTFEAVVSVFGNVDDGGDRVVKGAFAKTLETRGLPPLVWSHMWDTPPIGATMDASETGKGLRIKGRLFVGDGEDSPTARAVYTAMKARDGRDRPVLREFSFGYGTVESRMVEEKGQDIRELTELDLFEVGPTLVGMNPATELVGIKTMSVDEARRVLGIKQDQEENDEHEDNPDPNSPVGDEEGAARIRLLVADRRIYIPEEG